MASMFTFGQKVSVNLERITSQSSTEIQQQLLTHKNCKYSYEHMLYLQE